MTIFMTLAMVMFFFLSFIWKCKLWLNFFIKFAFFGMGCWSGFNLMNMMGYIVKVGG